MNNVSTIFFDLDGTLIDSKEGITKSIKFALEQMGFSSPSVDDLTQHIGPSLSLFFGNVLGVENAETAIGHFRQRYEYENACLTEAILYPDILQVLATLRQSKKKLYVVTAKPKPIAERIVKHFDLHSYFQSTHGPAFDESHNDKGELIASILEQERISTSEAIMVGDRKHDILGA